MKSKPLLCPERRRRVPRQFSWIDQRLVRDGHLGRCGPHALALYLLLCTVADAQGLSYYSDASAARLLSLSAGQLREARAQLVAAGLIAYRAPFYQVLSLDRPAPAPAVLPPCSPAPQPSPPAPPRTSPGLSLAEVLRQMLEGRAS